MDGRASITTDDDAEGYRQYPGSVPGKKYRFTYEVELITSSKAAIYVNGIDISYAEKSGTYELNFVANNNSFELQLISYIGTAMFDNISLQKIVKDHYAVNH